jgi:F-type H+-transporting ATPase subunit epsilon
MKLEVLTPKKLEFQDEVSDVILPAMDGEISVLNRHASLVSVLKPGRIKIRTKDREVILNIEGGILQVSGNSAFILLKNFNKETRER